ncbi:MAG: hypothetical protein ACK41F_13615 [Fimbriimonadaceae bacterium]
MNENLDALLFGSLPEGADRLRLDETCLSHALLAPSRTEARAFFLAWLHEMHRLGAPRAQEAAVPVWLPFQAAMVAAEASLRAMVSGEGDSASGALREALQEDAEELGREWIERGRALREAMDAAAARREGSVRQRLRQAFDLLGEAAAETGIERQERLREAAQIFHTLLTEEGAEVDPVVRLLAGWTGLQRGFQDQSVVSNLFQACLQLGPGGGALAWFAGRTLAATYRRREALAEVADSLAFALVASPDPETRWAAAAAFADSERHEEAARQAVQALQSMPSLAAGLWAVPSFEPLLGRLGLAAAELARSEARRARERLQAWGQEAERARAGLSLAGVDADLPAALDDDRAAVARVAGRSPLEDRYAASIAEQRTRDLQDWLLRRLTAGFDERLARWRSAVAEMQARQEEFEASVREAVKRKEASEEAIRRRLAAFGGTSDHLQTGCAWGLGIGCGGLALYVCAFVLATALGRPFRVDNPVAVILFALVFAPAGIAMLLTIGYTLRYLALEAEANAALRSLQAEFDSTVAALQAAHADSVRRLRERVEAVAAEVRRVERAFASLGLPVPERAGWNPETGEEPR